MSKYIIRLFIISSAFTIETDKLDKPSVCLTDEKYGSLTEEEYYTLAERRSFIRKKNITNLFRNEIDTLSIPIIFHNYYQMKDGVPVRSFCDYVTGHSENTWEYNNNNDPQI